MSKIDNIFEKVQRIKADKSASSRRYYRPYIVYDEKVGYTVTIYYANDYLELIYKIICGDEMENHAEYLQAHIVDARTFKTHSGIKEYIAGIVGARKPCFISGEYDKQENKSKLTETLYRTGYTIL